MTASFRRAPDFDRRTDMIEATLDCIADLGIQATTVRAVAARAGVSNGLIRHHFASKANLIAAAYQRMIEMMTLPALSVLESDGGTPPHDRLTRFIAASLGGAVADPPRMLSLWATFVSQVHLDPDLEHEHREGYLAFRRATETLIAEVLSAEGREPTPQSCRNLAIAVNALIDGLSYAHGSLSADEIDETTQIGIGLSSIGALLGIELPDAPPLPRE
ncbi:BetI family transcriptional regulator [Brucella intermedia 229E]|uniref:BetI family transcriptional regulator n=1 Tax=Brucella intermedia 229E TaxID=1337887 RepID=U4V617_9HYPH|nr:BetI family transcriptional regulator [Brucella intermedia 229E]